ASAPSLASSPAGRISGSLRPMPRTPFDWHPEPALVGFRDPGVSRAPLERLGDAAWKLCLDYLYDEAMRRPVGPDSYTEMRRRLFTTPRPDGRTRPAPPPLGPRSSA